MKMNYKVGLDLLYRGREGKRSGQNEAAVPSNLRHTCDLFIDSKVLADFDARYKIHVRQANKTFGVCGNVGF
jgi:hypothetical protein